MLQTRRNAWTAFQTSACYSAFKDRASLFDSGCLASSCLASNLGHRGGHEDDRAGSSWGAVSTLGAPCCQEGVLQKTPSPFRPKVPAIYTGLFVPSSIPGWLSRPSFAPSGAASIPTPGSPSRVRPGHPVRHPARGALCSPSEESRQEVPRLRCLAALQPLSTGSAL